MAEMAETSASGAVGGAGDPAGAPAGAAEAPVAPAQVPAAAGAAQGQQAGANPGVASARPPVPEGMSKKQWKKLQKKQRFQEQKAEYAKIRKEKKRQSKQNRRELIKSIVERGEEIPEHLKKHRHPPVDQVSNNTKIVIDCGFDSLMNDKEIISLSSQITRAYSTNRKAQHCSSLEVSSYGGELQKRFETGLKDNNPENWKDIVFNPEPFQVEDLSRCVYLSADAEEYLDELHEGFTYIIGGIVDKGRYKNLCQDKAQKLNIKTAKLPIDKHIRLDGRKVLTTTHVVELLVKWWDTKDWKKTFAQVLPQRKLLEERESPVAAAEQAAVPAAEPNGQPPTEELNGQPPTEELNEQPNEQPPTTEK